MERASTTTGRDEIAGARRRLCLVVALPLLLAAPAHAEELTGFLEIVADSGDSEREDAAAPDQQQEIESLSARLNFTWDKPLLPTLRLLTGGLFELVEVDSDIVFAGQQPVSSETTTTRLAPYIDLILDTEVFSADLTFNLNEEEVDPSLSPSTTLVQKRYAARFNWSPVDLPSLGLRLTRTENYDREGLFNDTTDDVLQLDSEYYPIENLRLQYQGTFRELDDDFNDSRLESEIHNARIVYNERFFRDRMTLNSDYSISYRDTETAVSGQGGILLPTFPIAGLSSVDDTPINDPLNPNPALIDQNRAVSAGLDIGLQPPGGDTRARNVGLDFGSDIEVDTLLVSVDRDLDPGISDSFVWEIYVSDDNDIWLLHDIVAPATFGPFITRFELRFARVSTRYVKAVVEPLSPSVPFSQNFPNILITELEGGLSEAAADLETSSSSTSHLYSLDSRVRILDSPSLFYELTYFLNDPGSNPSTYTLSNGLSLSHTFNEVYSTFARFSREDGEEQTEDRTAYNLTASLNARPLSTLSHNLVFSAREVDIGDESNDDKSVFLFSVAELYRGVDLNVGIGRSYRENRFGEIETTQYNISSTLVPHRSTTINLLYQEKTDDFTAGRRVGDADIIRSEQVSLAFRPLATLYLFGSHRIERKPDIPERTIDNYVLSWSPFPDGTMHFTFSYNETSRSEFDTTERIITPSLRWDITRRSYLDVAYQKLSRDTINQEIETEILSGTLRVGF